jgi:hypothetical protein
MSPSNYQLISPSASCLEFSIKYDRKWVKYLLNPYNFNENTIMLLVGKELGWLA